MISTLFIMALVTTPLFADKTANSDSTGDDNSGHVQVAQRYNLVVGDFQCEAFWQTSIGRGYYTQFRTQFAGSTVELRNHALALHRPNAGVVLSDVTCEDSTQAD